VVQESFVAAYLRLDTLRDRKRFAPWLATIARNTAISQSRKAQREQALRSAIMKQPHQGAPEEGREELHQLLHRELAALEPNQRELLLLYYFRGMSTRAMAETLEISIENAKKRLQRARTQLGERIVAQMTERNKAFQPDERRLQQLTRAVLCVPVAWHLPGAVGTGAVLGGLWEMGIGKMAAAAAILLLAGFAAWQAPRVLRPDAPVQAEVAAGSVLVTAPPTEASEPLPELAPEAEVVLAKETAPPPASETDDLTAPELAEDYWYAADEGYRASEPGPGIIRGRVQTTDGHPMPGVRVEATRRRWDTFRMPDRQQLTLRTTTGHNGAFELSGIALDTFILRAQVPGKQAIRTCTLRDDQPHMDVTMGLRDVASIAGWVVNAEGNPLPNVLVSPFYTEYENRRWRLDIRALHSTVTDEFGAFRVDNIWPEGDWQIMAQAPGYSAVISERVPTGTTDLELRLEPGLTLDAQVLNVDSMDPVAGIELCLLSSDGMTEKLCGVTGLEGRMQLRGLRQGETYRPGGEPPNGLLWEGDTQVRAVLEEGHLSKTFTVSEGARISGRVKDQATNNPIAGVMIGLQREVERAVMTADGQQTIANTTQVATADTDHEGKFLLQGIREGAYVITAAEPALRVLAGGRFSETNINIHRPMKPLQHHGEDIRLPISLERGEFRSGVEITVELEPAAVISGTVVDPSGRPVLGADVGVRPTHGGAVRGTFSGNSGEFTLALLDFDEELYLQAWTLEMASQVYGPLSLAEDDIHGKVIRLEPACGTLVGRVVDAQGEPVYALAVQARPEGVSVRPPAEGMTNNAGRFELLGMAPGQHTIHLGPTTMYEGRLHTQLRAGRTYAHQPDTAQIEVHDCHPRTGLTITYDP